LTSPLLPLSIQRFVNGTSGAIEHGDEVRIDRLSRISRPSAGLWNSLDRRCSSSIFATKVSGLYWLFVYLLIATAVFSTALLFILTGFIWFEMEAWRRRLIARQARHRVTIDMPVSVPNLLVNGGSDDD
jgi:hypothetical protein